MAFCTQCEVLVLTFYKWFGIIKTPERHHSSSADAVFLPYPASEGDLAGGYGTNAFSIAALSLLVEFSTQGREYICWNGRRY